MTRPFLRVCVFLLGATCAQTIGAQLSARADGAALSASSGVAGRYRPGGWCPVTVTVRNPGPDVLTGQLQISSDSSSSRSSGRPSGQPADAATFSRAVTVAGGASSPQTFQIYTRGIDPGRGDLTVRLAEGARGDGHVLAQISSQDTNASLLFSGVPVSENDVFLVGFGGDPSAFRFLNGRPWNAGVLPAATSQATPPTLQVAEAAGASELPDKAAGYEGVDAFLLRGDAPVDGLTGAQADALKGWVASGGHLIVCGSGDLAPFGAAFFENLLPATVSVAHASGVLRLTPKPLPGIHVLSASASGTPLVVSGPYGAGSVTLTAVTPTSPAFWQTLLSGSSGRSSTLLSQAASREENGTATFYYSGNPLPMLSSAVMRGPSLDAPGTMVIGGFLLVYLLVLVPANYLVLKRLDRKELAWVTIPALVIVFAAGTFGVGYAAKGGAVFVNRAALVETTAGQSEAGVYSEIGLFSPHRTSYDIAVTGTNSVAAVPNPGFRYGGGGGDDAEVYGPAKFVQTGSGVSLPDTAVNMWAMRAFDAQSTVDLGGTIDAALTAQGGSVVNHTPYALTECALFRNGQWQPLGDLAPGASLAFPKNANNSTGLPNGINSLPALTGENRSPNSQTDIHQRMRIALAAYVRSLGGQYRGQSYNSMYNGGQPAMPAYKPTPGEAIFVGWSRDPALAGPSPRVDGRAVTENDVSLVIVHVPAPLTPNNGGLGGL